MSRNDTIILIVACAILIIGGFIVLNNRLENSSPSTSGINPELVSDSSLLLNPDDVTIPRLETGKSTTSSSTSTVSLTQVPYTGVESNIKISLFVLAMAAWTGGLSYFLVRRKAFLK